MPETDKEVFEYFFGKQDISQAVAGLAYAAYAFDKYAWVDKQTSRRGHTPIDSEVTEWIASLPDSTLDKLVTEADDLFDRASKIYLGPAIEEQKVLAAKQATEGKVEETLRTISISCDQTQTRVRQFTSFYQNLIPNIGVGLISSFLFVGLVIVASLIFARDPSPIALAKHLGANQSPGPRTGE